MASYYTLKNASGFLGLQHRTQPYLIGFHKRAHAYLVRDHVQQDPSISLIRHVIEDVTDDVIQGLKAQGLERSFYEQLCDVSIDLEASLIIPKKNTSQVSPILEISEIFNDEFMMLPFTKGIGIAMPFDLEKEDDDKFVFIARVVDPADTIDMFKKSLMMEHDNRDK